MSDKKPFAVTLDVEGDYWEESQTRGIVEGIPRALEIFRNIDAKGTFFWTAETALKHPDIFNLVVEQGHEIGCHSFRHENMSILNTRQQTEVLENCLRVFNALKTNCTGFRAPRLRVNDSLYPVLRDLGFRYDSSIPFWGLRRYKYGHRYDACCISELKCIPSYAFRLSGKIFSDAVRRSYSELGYCVVFLHPWEFIENSPSIMQASWKKRSNFINWICTGESFSNRFESFIVENRHKFKYLTCDEISRWSYQ